MTRLDRLLSRSDARIGMVLVVTYAVLALTVPRYVDSGGHVLVRAAGDGLLALGLTTVILQGELDLSVGSTLALAGAVTVGLAGSIGYVPAVGVALLVGVAVGLTNGLIVTRARVNSFIATLGTMIAIRGLVFIYTGSQPISGPSLEVAVAFSQPVVLGLTPRVLIFLAVAAALALVLGWTRVGRDLYAVGGGREAAAAAGIPIERRIWLGFVISGMCAALAGAAVAIELNTGSPVIGSQAALVAITAVVIGGTRLTGGRGTALGTVLGVLVLAALAIGLNLARVSSSYQQVITGAILVAVVLGDEVRVRPFRARLAMGWRRS